MSSLLGFITSTGMQVYKLFADKGHANKTYKQVLPSLKRIISQQGRNSKNAEDLLNVLVNLAPFGARRVILKDVILTKLAVGENYQMILVSCLMAFGINL